MQSHLGICNICTCYTCELGSDFIIITIMVFACKLAVSIQFRFKILFLILLFMAALSTGNSQVVIPCCIDNGLVNQANCTHGGVEQHRVFMCKIAAEFNKLQLVVNLDQQHHVLSVVLNELFKVVVVECIQRAFIVRLLFIDFILTHKIQAIAVHFMISVFAIQLQIVQVHTPHNVPGGLHATILFVLALFGQLAAQAQAPGFILAQDLENTIV